jgi:hypothetical protein
MRPAGPTFAVYHFHSGKLSLGWYVGELELAVGRQALFFNQVQYSTEPSPANHN